MDVLTVCLICLGIALRQFLSKRVEPPLLKIDDTRLTFFSVIQILFCSSIIVLIAFPFVNYAHFFGSVVYGISSPLLILGWLASVAWLIFVIRRWPAISKTQQSMRKANEIVETSIRTLLAQSALKNNSIALPSNLVRKFDLLLSAREQIDQDYYLLKYMRLMAICLFVLASTYLPQTFSEDGIRYFKEFGPTSLIDIILMCVFNLALWSAFSRSIRPAIRMIVVAIVLLAIGYSSDVLIEIYSEYFST